MPDVKFLWLNDAPSGTGAGQLGGYVVLGAPTIYVVLYWLEGLQ